MTWTTQDLEAANQAIRDLRDGKQVTQFRSANGKSVTYTAAQLDDLLTIRSVIRAELSQQSSTAGGRRSRTRHVVTSKGL